jgi:sphingolipid delta-4 desaturase
MMVYQLPFTKLHILNFVIQLVFDYLVVARFGGNAVVYFIMSSFLAGSLHPCAGHFIAEHVSFGMHIRHR